MRRLIWLPVLALTLFVLWLMISTPTKGRYWQMVYPGPAATR